MLTRPLTLQLAGSLAVDTLSDPFGITPLVTLLPQQDKLIQVLQPNDGTDQQLLDSKGTYHARFGSTTGADTNDPTRVLAERMNRLVVDDYFHIAPFTTLNGWSLALVLNRAGNEDATWLWSSGTDAEPTFGHINVKFGTGVDVNKIVVEIDGGEGSLTSTIVFPTGVHDLIITKAPGFDALTIYIDGGAQGTSTKGAGAAQTTNPFAKLGARVDANGMLADTKLGAFSFWNNHALSVAQIATVRAALKTLYPTLP